MLTSGKISKKIVKVDLDRVTSVKKANVEDYTPYTIPEETTIEYIMDEMIEVTICEGNLLLFVVITINTMY